MRTPRPLGGDQAQALAQLDAAVAAQRAERIAGQALGVQPDQHVGRRRRGHRRPGRGTRGRTAARRRGPRTPRRASAMGDADRFDGRPSHYPPATRVVPAGRRRAILRPMAVAAACGSSAPRQVEIRPVELPALGDGQVLVAHGVLRHQRRHRAARLPRPARPRAWRVDETIGALGGTFRYPFQYGYSCVGRVEESRVRARRRRAGLRLPSAPGPVRRSRRRPRPARRRSTLASATLLPLVETALQLTLDAGPVLEETVVVRRPRRRRSADGGAAAAGRGAASSPSSPGLAPRGRRRLGRSPPSTPTPSTSAGGGGRADGVGLVVEVSGNPAALADGLGLLAHEGTALVGSWYGDRPSCLPLGGRFHRRRLTIRSTQVSTIPARLSARWDRTRRLATSSPAAGGAAARAARHPHGRPRGRRRAFAALDDRRGRSGPRRIGVQLTPMFQVGTAIEFPAKHIMPGMEGPEGELHEHHYRLEVAPRAGAARRPGHGLRPRRARCRAADASTARSGTRTSTSSSRRTPKR